MALAALAAIFGGCGGGGSEESARERGPSEEYKAARVVRSFLLAYSEGDADSACRRLTPEYRQAVARQGGRPSCERALSLQAAAVSNRNLDRLRRARITKVDVSGDAAKAEVLLRGAKRPERLTAQLRRISGAWHLSADLVKGGLASGRVPKPPPGPPRDPEEEQRIASVFERYREAVEQGDGRRACSLQTTAARQGLVDNAVELLGGERAAIREFGTLDCEHVVVRFEIPATRVVRIVAEEERGRLTLKGGAQYLFRKVQGEWKLDS